VKAEGRAGLEARCLENATTWYTNTRVHQHRVNRMSEFRFRSSPGDKPEQAVRGFR
jgi:hypothetical protein